MLLQECVSKLNSQTPYSICFVTKKLGYYIGQGDITRAKMILTAAVSS